MSSSLPRRIVTALATTCCIAAMAALPPLDDAAKAKAAEAAARTAWTDKVAAYQLCKSQDAVAAQYFAQMKQEGKPVSPPIATAECADPGPYAAPTPPLEAAGAHSPPATASGPPNSKATEAELRGGAKN
jgi:hypothetical protein